MQPDFLKHLGDISTVLLDLFHTKYSSNLLTLYIIYTCMCVYLCIHNKYTQYTHKYIMSIKMFILDAINRCPALIQIIIKLCLEYFLCTMHIY